MLAKLYQARWDSDVVVRDIVDFKKLDVFVSSLTSDERRYPSSSTSCASESPEDLPQRAPRLHRGRLVDGA